MMEKVKKIKNIAKEIIQASIGYIKDNQTFVTKPPERMKNCTTVDDLKEIKKKKIENE